MQLSSKTCKMCNQVQKLVKLIHFKITFHFSHGIFIICIQFLNLYLKTKKEKLVDASTTATHHQRGSRQLPTLDEGSQPSLGSGEVAQI